MSSNATVNYTPLAHLTDEEFVHALVVKQDPTDYETEAMLRLERLLEDRANVKRACECGAAEFA